jgi:hypothetical protein
VLLIFAEAVTFLGFKIEADFAVGPDSEKVIVLS